MNGALWKKGIAESAILLGALALGVALFSWMRVHIVGEVDTTSFEKILSLLPEEWLRFASVDIQWMISYVGRTAMTLDEPFLVMLIAIWGIVRGSDVVSGEISRGTMEMLLAQPVSRVRVYLVHTAITVGGVVLLSAITWLSMWIAVLTTNVTITSPERSHFWDSVLMVMGGGPPADETADRIFEPMANHVASGLFAPGILNLALFGFFVAGMATLLSAVDRYRWRTLGLAVALYLGAAMLKILAMSSESLSWANWLSFFSLYEPELAVKLFQEDAGAVLRWRCVPADGALASFGPLAHNTTLAVGAIVFFAAGLLIFRRRDIPAPL